MNFDILTQIFNQFVAALPKIIGALLLLIIGWIISKIVAGIIRRLLVSLKVDKVADKLNEIEIVQKTNMSIVPSTFLSKTIFYVLMLVFMIAAADMLQLEAVSNLIVDFIAYIPKLISALILLIVGLLIANFIKGIVDAACRSLQIPGGKIISVFIFYFIFINILLSAMNQAEISIDFLSSNLTMIFGGIILAFAVGYGFASRDIMSNLLAAIYSKDKFKVGDQVKIQEVKGEIINVDSTSVTIQTNDAQVIIPLSQVVTDKIEKFN